MLSMFGPLDIDVVGGVEAGDRIRPDAGRRNVTCCSLSSAHEGRARSASWLPAPTSVKRRLGPPILHDP